MVYFSNHACMTEGHRRGRMCFCETDRCNGAAEGQKARAEGAVALNIAVTAAVAATMKALITS